MTRSANNEFIQLQLFLEDLPPVEPHEHDSWSFVWGQHFYSSSKFYQYQYKDLHPEKSITWIWKSKCVPTIKFFAWLLLNNRLNTRNILKRRRNHLDDGYNCVLCHENVEETVEHLFFECSSTVTCWFDTGINWNENSNIHQKIYIAKMEFAYAFFMEVFMIGAWIIWKKRNDFIFSHKPPCLASWKVSFKNEVLRHLLRIKSSLHPSILQA
jgi:hypothetical protein